MAVSFLLVVLLPTALVAWYLWARAADRYASSAGFSVRAESAASPMELLGGLAALGGTSSSSDTDVLYRFIQSQEIVALVDARLDLRAMWSRPGSDWGEDPVFAYHAPGTIEDLHDHWRRMVAVYNDRGTGLIDVEVQAFAPADARAISRAIVEESTALVNRLSAIAQEDATASAREELEVAVERLKDAREALTRFRNETQIVDPVLSIQAQTGLLSSLEAQLATTLIELDLLRQTARPDDPRVRQAERRQAVIEARMAEERAKMGLGTATGEGAPGAAFADLVGAYESLAVDQEFAQTAYTAALAAFDAAQAESRRQSRYLAAHVQPTLAERSDYPRRWEILGLTALFAGLLWVIATFTAYALRDRR